MSEWEKRLLGSLIRRPPNGDAWTRNADVCKSMAVAPLQTEVHWLCTKSSVGGKLFPMRPAWESLCNCLLYVGPEKSQIGFWQGAGLLTPYP